MNTLTQTLRRRQAVILYAERYGVTAASRRYNVSRPTIYSWKKRYDGSLGSLKDFSRHPHHHPNDQYTFIDEYSRFRYLEAFQEHRTYSSSEEFKKQLAVWERKYNSFPMRPLNWRSPKVVLSSLKYD